MAVSFFLNVILFYYRLLEKNLQDEKNKSIIKEITKEERGCFYGVR